LDSILPMPQADDDAGRQQRHRNLICRSGEHDKRFDSTTGLMREVFFDLGLNRELVKLKNLPFASLGSLFKGREQFLEKIRYALGQVDHRGHQRFAAITASASAAAGAVEQLLPRLSPAGHVLVTSRLRGWSCAVESLAIDILAEQDAAAFLLERTESRRRKLVDDSELARQLAVELGQLALALEQAPLRRGQRRGVRCCARSAVMYHQFTSTPYANSTRPPNSPPTPPLPRANFLTQHLRKR
jgi:hypothetical protein